MMDYIKNNPRRSIIFGSFILAFIVFYIRMGMGLGAMLAIYLIITVIFMLVYHADCLAILGNIFYHRGRMDKAVPIYQFVIKRNTKSPAAYLYYAMYLMRNGKAEEAKPLLDMAEHKATGVISIKNIQLTQASCQWLMGDIGKAIEILEKMRERYEYVNARVLSTLGYLYVLQGDMEKGESLTRQALEDSPDSHASWDNLGQIYYRKNDFMNAKENFEKALEYKNDLPDSLYYMGLIARAEGNEAGAKAYFDKALNCNINALNTVTREQIMIARDF
jgi:tetratricopeptide (TPR) repeat protein